MSDHTPGPWAVTGRDSPAGADLAIIADGVGEIGYASTRFVGCVVAEANAAHIVRCVNAHDDMLEALEAVEAMLDDPGNHPELPVRRRVIAAIAAAKGDTT